MNEANGLNEVIFTSAAVLDLLLQIDELSDYTIGMTETLDGDLQLQVGNSIYLIDSQDSKIIRVEDQIVGEIEITTEEAYDEILQDVEVESDLPSYDEVDAEADDVVEGSFIKDIAKSLALGGLIRFATKNLLK